MATFTPEQQKAIDGLNGSWMGGGTKSGGMAGLFEKFKQTHAKPTTEQMNASRASAMSGSGLSDFTNKYRGAQNQGVDPKNYSSWS